MPERLQIGGTDTTGIGDTYIAGQREATNEWATMAQANNTIRGQNLDYQKSLNSNALQAQQIAQTGALERARLQQDYSKWGQQNAFDYAKLGQEGSQFAQTNQLNQQKAQQEAEYQKGQLANTQQQLQQTGAYQTGELAARQQDLQMREADRQSGLIRNNYDAQLNDLERQAQEYDKAPGGADQAAALRQQRDALRAEMNQRLAEIHPFGAFGAQQAPLGLTPAPNPLPAGGGGGTGAAGADQAPPFRATASPESVPADQPTGGQQPRPPVPQQSAGDLRQQAEEQQRVAQEQRSSQLAAAKGAAEVAQKLVDNGHASGDDAATLSQYAARVRSAGPTAGAQDLAPTADEQAALTRAQGVAQTASNRKLISDALKPNDAKTPLNYKEKMARLDELLADHPNNARLAAMVDGIRKNDPTEQSWGDMQSMINDAQTPQERQSAIDFNRAVLAGHANGFENSEQIKQILASAAMNKAQIVRDSNSQHSGTSSTVSENLNLGQALWGLLATGGNPVGALAGLDFNKSDGQTIGNAIMHSDTTRIKPLLDQAAQILQSQKGDIKASGADINELKRRLNGAAKDAAQAAMQQGGGMPADAAGQHAAWASGNGDDPQVFTQLQSQAEPPGPGDPRFKDTIEQVIGRNDENTVPDLIHIFQRNPQAIGSTNAMPYTQALAGIAAAAGKMTKRGNAPASDNPADPNFIPPGRLNDKINANNERLKAAVNAALQAHTQDPSKGAMAVQMSPMQWSQWLDAHEGDYRLNNGNGGFYVPGPRGMGAKAIYPGSDYDDANTTGAEKTGAEVEKWANRALIALTAGQAGAAMWGARAAGATLGETALVGGKSLLGVGDTGADIEALQARQAVGGRALAREMGLPGRAAAPGAGASQAVPIPAAQAAEELAAKQAMNNAAVPPPPPDTTPTGSEGAGVPPPYQPMQPGEATRYTVQPPVNGAMPQGPQTAGEWAAQELGKQGQPGANPYPAQATPDSMAQTQSMPAINPPQQVPNPPEPVTDPAQQILAGKRPLRGPGDPGYEAEAEAMRDEMLKRQPPENVKQFKYPAGKGGTTIADADKAAVNAPIKNNIPNNGMPLPPEMQGKTALQGPGEATALERAPGEAQAAVSARMDEAVKRAEAQGATPEQLAQVKKEWQPELEAAQAQDALAADPNKAKPAAPADVRGSQGGLRGTEQTGARGVPPDMEHNPGESRVVPVRKQGLMNHGFMGAMERDITKPGMTPPPNPLPASGEGGGRVPALDQGGPRHAPGGEPNDFSSVVIPPGFGPQTPLTPKIQNWLATQPPDIRQQFALYLHGQGDMPLAIQIAEMKARV